MKPYPNLASKGFSARTTCGHSIIIPGNLPSIAEGEVQLRFSLENLNFLVTTKLNSFFYIYILGSQDGPW